MNIHSDLTEQQLVTICNHIVLSSPQTVCDNEWVFFTKHMPLPFLWQAFIIEFTNPYIKDVKYRQNLHIVTSEIYQSCQN